MANVKVDSLLKGLHRLEVEFIIIGGMAAVAQGSAFLTADLDLCYSRKKENLEKLAKALEPFHPLLRGAPKDLPFCLDITTLRSGLNFTLVTDAGDLDILGEVTGVGDYNDLLLFSEELAIFGIHCKVLTLEGLIKTKRATGRAKDLRLLPELEALLESQRKMKGMDTAICEAIKKKTVIQFNYHGTLRIVEPQCHGISTAGNEVLRGFQTKDYGKPEEPPNNKLFEVSKLSDLRETGKNFLNPGPHYNPNDKSMIYVHCHL